MALSASAQGQEARTCPGAEVFTIDAGEDQAQICAAVERVRDQLAQCNLTVPLPITIAILPELGENCLGVFHCGDGRIDLLAPSHYARMQQEGDNGAFRVVSPHAMFESVLRHEMAHAALDSMPCPFDSCLVAQEYIAYTMQIRFLPEMDRAAFEAQDRHDGPVSRETLNPMILLMAPDVFAHRAWQHLTEREDPCAFIGQVARAEVLLDFEHH
jgi:hypothetical protein